jgi:hypothetical protein
LASSTSSSGEDEEVEIKRDFDSSKASIKYVQGEGPSAYGFCLGTQDAYFKLSDGTHVTARYRDNEIINVAMMAASKIVEREISKEDNEKLVEDFLNSK